MNTKAFTLIETLVAIFILTVAIVVPLTVASRELNAALIAKDQTTATYLAQDAVEYVRGIRDTSCLQYPATGPQGCFLAPPLLAVVAACDAANDGCRVDTLNDWDNYTSPYRLAVSCVSDPGGVCKPLEYDSSDGWYNYLSGTPSIFTRTVLITPVSGENYEYQVQVTVSWHDVSSALHSVVATENLYAWE